ncbi:hypothetical protein HanPI659440_Chr10g0369001 [Helianthus annuus]|nr:hypothetical protein HanPI659440_Chr10g0369001 [Helianthus annuus]
MTTFSPFALPEVVAEPTDGHLVGNFPLAVIPAPVPLAAYPVVDMPPPDVASDDDSDLLEEDPFEGEALLLLVLAYCLRTLLRGKLMPIPLSQTHLSF